MHPHRHLALASLILAAAFAAAAAQAETKDSHPAPDYIELTSSAMPSEAQASCTPVPAAPQPLPDDPSAASQQAPPTPPDSQQTGGPISADQQLKIQEKQRVLGVMAAFNTTINRDALPLSPAQKFQLFFKSQTDPWPFGLAAVVAGINQADNSPAEYGQGTEGYAKRFGATYTDAFIGNLFGNAILTTWWHEDPRYFQKGTGSTGSRILWAATSTVWSRRDNGTWGPNYANVAGNLIGAAIANVYYPASERTVGDTVSRGLTVSVEGIVGAEIIEFWPDMLRRYQRKKAEKLARQNPQTAQTPQAAPAPWVADPKP